MKKQLRAFLTHPLFSGSILMIFGSNFANALSYLYHLVMGRLLGPSNYADLATLFSLIGLIGIIPQSLSLVVTRFVSKAKTQQERQNIIGWFYRKVIVGSIILVALLFVGTPFIAQFLKIKNNLLIILTALGFLFSFPTLVNYSILQGLLRFKEFIISNVVANFLKLVLGVILVYIGWGNNGAFLGLLGAGFITWSLTEYFVKGLRKSKKLNQNITRDIYFYTFPILIQYIAVTSLYSTDLILVKHFFSSYQAGIYASLSTLGRIVYFGIYPITLVMFPVISQKHSRNEPYAKVFWMSILLATFLIALLLSFYYFLPNLAINVLFGRFYLGGSNLLFYFGLFMSLFTLSTIFINFYLSIGNTKVVVLPTLAAIFQIIGINLFHYNLLVVIEVSIWINALLLLSLFVYFWYENKAYIGNRSRL